MPYQTGLPAALARFGLRVELVPGWETRGSANFNPRGAVAHWTAGPRGSKTRPSLNICVNGRAGLPGPLCNVYLDRNGVAVVVAAGTANHAGVGGWKGLTGNSQVFGTEAECGGDNDWTPEQRAAYPRVNAAYCWLRGFSPDMVCGHSEWAPSRKIDIRDWPMSLMRSQIAAVLANPNLEEDEFMALFKDRADFEQAVNRAAMCLTPVDRKTPWAYDMIAGTDAKTGVIANDVASLRKELSGLRSAVDTLAKALAQQSNDLTAEEITEAVRRGMVETVNVRVSVDGDAA